MGSKRENRLLLGVKELGEGWGGAEKERRLDSVCVCVCVCVCGCGRSSRTDGTFPRVSLCTSGSRPHAAVSPHCPHQSHCTHMLCEAHLQKVVAVATVPTVSTLSHKAGGNAFAGDEAAPTGEGGCVRAAFV